jgi:DivIVA domain-containing protein
MDISNLTFTQTTFRRGYKQEDVDQFLEVAAANLARPLAERSLRADVVARVQFTQTMFRAGYDEHEVDVFMDQLGIELGLPLPAERQDVPSPPAPAAPTTPQATQASPPSVRPAPLTTADEPRDDYRPDTTFL